MGDCCIGIDVGGTFTKLALVVGGDERRSLLGVTEVPTPAKRCDRLIAAIVDAAKGLMGEHGIGRSDVLGVGLGLPGTLDRERGVVINSPNLPDMAGVAVGDRIGEGLNLPTVLENDGNAAALGEFLYGAGRDAGPLIMLTLGTGVGGGIVTDGKIFHGSHNFAAEIGHMIVQPDGLACKCGQRGCLEQYSAAGCLAGRAEAAVRDGRQSRLTGVLAEKGHIDAADVNAARKANDALAVEVWDAAVRYLAIACVSLERILDCDVIVLAGGLTKAGDDLMTPLRKYHAEFNWQMADVVPPITIADLGGNAGVMGAAGVARQTFGRQ